MILAQEDCGLFYKLMGGLQFYVNQTLQILPEIQSPQEFGALPMSDKARVRDALWKNPRLVNAYIVRKWSQFIDSTAL